MPVKKYHSFEEASTDLWVMQPDQAYYQKVREFMNVWSRLFPRPAPRLLMKFKGIQDAGQKRLPIPDVFSSR